MPTMQHHALDERHELSTTLRAAGPDAPTLRGDWTTAVLAAHLVRRERSLVEAAGRLPVRRLHDHSERRLVEVAARELPRARERAIWTRLRISAPLTMRAMRVGARLVWPGHGEIRAGRRGSGRPVTVTGEAVELALVAFGRQRVAAVDYDGTPEDVALVSGARIAV